MSKQGSDDRLLARDGFKHFRRTYSVAEVRWGVGVGLVLIAIAGWVYWKGQNPDPSLFAAPPLVGTMEGSGGDRGPLPDGLQMPGWKEGEVSHFDASNLYVKINGRADYFIGFGFEALHFVSLRAGAEDDAASVEVEVYNLGSSANALGAFAGERKAGGGLIESAGGVRHLARNALFLARGDYYVRVIGSEESPAVTALLEHVAVVFESAIDGGERPWAYELLGEGAGIAADRVNYLPKNAFSIEGASDVYVGRFEDETQLFVAVRADAVAAKALVDVLVEGFAETGERATDGSGWIVDRYVDSYAKAEVEDRFVLGVRGGADLAQSQAHLAVLRAALAALPAAVRDGASSAPAAAVDGAAKDGEPGSDDAGGDSASGAGPSIDLAPDDEGATAEEPDEPGRHGAEPGTLEEM